MARKFNVSTEALLFRLLNSKLLSKNTVNNIFHRSSHSEVNTIGHGMTGSSFCARKSTSCLNSSGFLLYLSRISDFKRSISICSRLRKAFLTSVLLPTCLGPNRKKLLLTKGRLRSLGITFQLYRAKLICRVLFYNRMHIPLKSATCSEQFPQAMVKLEVLNSRMKDFYDIWFLSRTFDFRGETLAKAIEKTFENQNTPITVNPTVFDLSFTKDEEKKVQRLGFIKKVKITDAPGFFEDVAAAVKVFLEPIVASIVEQQTFHGIWTAPDPWR